MLLHFTITNPFFFVILMSTGVLLQICEMLRRMNSLENEVEVKQLISRLSVVDPLRKGYYDYLG